MSKLKHFSLQDQKWSRDQLFSVHIKDDSKAENVIVENHIRFQNIFFLLQSSIYSGGNSMDHYPAINHVHAEILYITRFI